MPDRTDDDSHELALPGSTRLSDVSLGALRRAALTWGLLGALLAIFVVMIHELAAAALLGAIVGSYLRRPYTWTARKLRSPAAATVLVVAVFTLAPLAVLVDALLQLRRLAIGLKDRVPEIAARIEEALARYEWLPDVDAETVAEPVLQQVVQQAARLPEGIREVAGELAIAASVFLFTVLYVLRRAEVVVALLRAKVPRRYGKLFARLESHLQGVLYGAVYATLVSQSLKAALVLVLCWTLGVPLAPVLATAAFVIGFFPIVGSWVVVIGAAAYLLVFESAPGAAAVMLVVGLGVGTVGISWILRPKLAAEQSRVLDFYWMFIGLVAGVYTFGVPGLVIGPIVLGLLNALFDTVTTEVAWAREAEGREPRVFKEEAVGRGTPPREPAGESEEDEEAEEEDEGEETTG